MQVKHPYTQSKINNLFKNWGGGEEKKTEVQCIKLSSSLTRLEGEGPLQSDWTACSLTEGFRGQDGNAGDLSLAKKNPPRMPLLGNPDAHNYSVPEHTDHSMTRANSSVIHSFHRHKLQKHTMESTLTHRYTQILTHFF